MGRKKNSTINVRVPKEIINSLKRVMPDHEGWDNPTRMKVMFRTSLVRMEDFLGGKKQKNQKK